MNIRRLKHLITILERVRDEAKPFDIRQWLQITEDHSYPACGTVACAIGHAALDPTFQVEGLYMDVKFTTSLVGHSDGYTEQMLCETADDYAEVAKGVYILTAAPIFGTHSGLPATAAFFDLTNHQAQRLFLGYSYPLDQKVTPDMVITAIKALLSAEILWVASSRELVPA